MLTPFARILIVCLIVGGVAFLLVKFNVIGSGKKEVAAQTTSDASNGNSNSSSSGSNESSNSSSSSTFDYTPAEPVGGILKGVVEVGATGFNSFIVTIDNQKRWRLEKAEFGSSLVYEGMASGQDVTLTLKNYISNMISFGVGPRNIHFVVSSGALKAKETQPIIRGLKGLGYVVNTVTPEQEGQLALKCVLPNDYKNQAFVTDIGSGNTKISWTQNGQVRAVESLGAKYFQNNIEHESAYYQVKSVAEAVPSNLSNACFIIGGVPFQMAKLTRNGKERFTVLNTAESYESQTGGEKKFESGLIIYKAIADATGCRTFVFDWDANFTIGFLLSL